MFKAVLKKNRDGGKGSKKDPGTCDKALKTGDMKSPSPSRDRGLIGRLVSVWAFTRLIGETRREECGRLVLETAMA